MEQLALTLSGKRYEVKLHQALAEFVKADLKQAGINFHTDNRPEILLKAYLHLAQKSMKSEKEIALLLKTLDTL